MLKTIPPDFGWSFSKLSTFETCPRNFYLTYIEKHENLDNAFSNYGTLCHSVLERWALGEVLEFEMAGEYEKLYDEKMALPFPPYPKGMAGKYYEAGKIYFESFEGFGDEWEVVSAEEKFVLNIGGNKFTGIGDLVLRHKVTGELMVIDHKSKSMNSMKKELETYKKQLYIYAMYCKQKFDQYPKILRFNMFKDRAFIDEEFSMEKLNDVTRWVIESIEKIKLEMEWPVNTSQYFCQHVCGVSGHCPAAMAQRK